MTDAPKKQRNRVAASCVVCRKRKSKCDRARPVCGSCKKKSIAHLCHYESENSTGDNRAQKAIPGVNVIGLGERPKYSSHNSMPIIPQSRIGPNGRFPEIPHAHGSERFMMHQGSYRDNANLPSDQSTSHRRSQTGQPFGSSNDAINQVYSEKPENVDLSNSVAMPSGDFLPQGRKYVGDPGLWGPMSERLTDLNWNKKGKHLIDDSTPLRSQPETPKSAEDSLDRKKPYYSSFPLDFSGRNKTLVNAPPSQPIVNGNIDMNSSTGLGERQGPNNLIDFMWKPGLFFKIDPRDTINISSNASASYLVDGVYWQQQGPLSYMGLFKSDEFLIIFRKYIRVLFRAGALSQYTANNSTYKKKTQEGREGVSVDSSKDDNSTAQNKVHKRKAIDQSGEKPQRRKRSELRSKSKTESSEQDVAFEDHEAPDGDVDVDDANIIRQINKKEKSMPTRSSAFSTMSPNIIIPNTVESEQELFQAIRLSLLCVLPRKKNLRILFVRFFKYVHPFVPVVDENTFWQNLERVSPGENIKHTDDTGSCTNVLVRSFVDVNIWSMVLLMIQLGVLTTMPNDDSRDGYNQDFKEITSDIERFNTDDYMKLLHLCLQDGISYQRSSFKLIQSLSLFYFYRVLAPNNSLGFGDSESQTLIRSIMNHALTIGLNRDPKKYEDYSGISQNKSLIETWRRLWHNLLATDVYSAMNSGFLFALGTTEISDVEKPNLFEGRKEFQDFFHMEDEILDSFRMICELLTNINRGSLVVSILRQTYRIEGLLENYFGDDFFFETISHKANEFEHEEGGYEKQLLRVLKFRSWLRIMSESSCIYYKIALFYEKEYKKVESFEPGIHFFKLYVIRVVRLLYIISYLLEHSNEIFGSDYEYILNSSNEKCMIKIHVLIASFFVRLLHCKRGFLTPRFDLSEEASRQERTKAEVLDRLFLIVLSNTDLFLENLRKLSKNYINSYRIRVLSVFIIRQATDNANVFFDRAEKDEGFKATVNMLNLIDPLEIDLIGTQCMDFKSFIEKYEKDSKSSVTANESHETSHSDSYDSKTASDWKEFFNDFDGFNFDSSIFALMNGFLELKDPLGNQDDMSHFLYDFAGQQMGMFDG